MKNEEIDLLIKNGFVLTDDNYFKEYRDNIIFINEKENSFKLTLYKNWNNLIIFNDVDIDFILKFDSFMELALNEVSEYIEDVYFRDNNYKYFNSNIYETYHKTINFFNQDIRIIFSRYLRKHKSYYLTFYSIKSDDEILISDVTNLIILKTLEELINGKELIN